MKKRMLAIARGLAVGAMLWAPIVAAHGSSAGDVKSQVIGLVQKIQRDDYEGNRAALQSDFAELTPFLNDVELSAAVHYWRGFALWRRAINGFNETVDAKEQEADLKGAIDEFALIPEAAAVYGDARIGMVLLPGLSSLFEWWKGSGAHAGIVCADGSDCEIGQGLGAG